MYGTGCARSDLTTCLPAHWGGLWPLVRSKQAGFLVLDFEQISVLSCLATAVEAIRTIQTGSNLAHWSFHARCPRSICVGCRQTYYFYVWCAKEDLIYHFSIIGYLLAYGLNAPQTSTIFPLRTVIKSVLWLVSIGELVAEIWSFQVWGGDEMFQNYVYTWFTCLDIDLNSV